MVHSAGIIFQSLGPMTENELSKTWSRDREVGMIGTFALIPDLSLKCHCMLEALGTSPSFIFHMYIIMYLSRLRCKDMRCNYAIRSQ